MHTGQTLRQTYRFSWPVTHRTKALFEQVWHLTARPKKDRCITNALNAEPRSNIEGETARTDVFKEMVGDERLELPTSSV